MNRNTSDHSSMSPTQKQAVLVCVVCALAILLTASITWVLIGRKGAQPPDASSAVLPEEDDLSEYYQIDETSAAVLPETADAGEEYLADTLFLGDSNTIRYYNNGLISLQQFCAKEGIGIQAALSEPIVAFKNDSNRYTIPQAVAMMKPRRVVIMLGTNDNGMSVDAFISHYTALVQAIQSAYPYTDIIVNTVPPVPQSHSNYPDMEQSKIDDFNMALLSMCESLGVKFLNSTEVLKDSTGYGNPDYYISGDIHLKNSGLKAILNYLRTHAWLTEDRRPDTSNIPTRVIDYTSNPSDAVEAPEQDPEQDPEVLFEARYQIDQNVGGTLTGAESGQTSLVYGISDPSETIMVTAVPDPGYVFVKWSDGLTAKTRTDTDFKQNLDVTAVFAAASVQISSEGSGILGMNYTFKATLSGKYTSADTLRWFVNGEEYTDVAGMTTISFLVDPVLANQSYKVYAVASYNDCEIVSNTLTVSFKGGVSSEETSSSSSSSSSSGSSSSSSSKPAASDSEEQEEPASRPAAAESESASSSSGSASSSKPASSNSSSGSASSSKPASSSSSSGGSASSSKPASSSSSSSSASSSKPASSNSSSGSASSSKPASSAAEDPLGDALSGVFDLFETNEKPASRG